MEKPTSITPTPDSQQTGITPAVDGQKTPSAVSGPDLKVPLSREGYRTVPDQETTAWPPGVPYIVGNEACERFSYYGMNAILYVQLTALYMLAGQIEEHAKSLATGTTHLFKAGVYALPLIGAILADRLIGKYRTILYLSLVYCAGHAVLALVDLPTAGDQKLLVMYVGLALIAVGSGGIKPCVSANVGDQFGKGNWFRVRTVYQIFYFSINFGSFFATLAIPQIKHWYGAGVAFAVPGVLMFLATVIFWMGRRKFVHVPPRPGGTIGLLDTLSSVCLFLAVGHLFFTKDMAWYVIVLASAGFLALGLWLFAQRQRLAPDDGFLAITLYSLRRFFAGTPAAGVNGEAGPSLARSRFWGPAVERFGLEATEGPVAVLKVLTVFFFISVFWSLFDQHSTSWIRQAEQMDLSWWGGQVLPSQVPSLNPLLVMLLIPLMNLVYTGCDRIGLKATPLRRMTVGMLVTALSFVTVALLQEWIDRAGPGKVWFVWQVIAYVLLTTGEVMVSITSLEFAYTQAPKRMKSTIMGFYMLAIALGNVYVVFLASFKDLALVEFFWIFAGLMAGAGLLFGLRALFYTPRDYPQE
jgi:POT family proton-dependent oligopeptide transporter